MKRYKNLPPVLSFMKREILRQVHFTKAELRNVREPVSVPADHREDSRSGAVPPQTGSGLRFASFSNARGTNTPTAFIYLTFILQVSVIES